MRLDTAYLSQNQIHEFFGDTGLTQIKADVLFANLDKIMASPSKLTNDSAIFTIVYGEYNVKQSLVISPPNKKNITLWIYTPDKSLKLALNVATAYLNQDQIDKLFGNNGLTQITDTALHEKLPLIMASQSNPDENSYIFTSMSDANNIQSFLIVSSPVKKIIELGMFKSVLEDTDVNADKEVIAPQLIRKFDTISYHSFLLTCAEQLVVDIIDLHPMMISKQDKDKRYLIHAAAETNKTHVIDKLVTKKATLVNWADKQDPFSEALITGETPFFIATKAVHLESMQLLIKSGASRNRPCNGLTPLTQILITPGFNLNSNRQIKAIKLLLGSDIDPKDSVSASLTDEEKITFALHFYEQQTKYLDTFHSATRTTLSGQTLMALAIANLKKYPNLLHSLVLYRDSDLWPQDLFVSALQRSQAAILEDALTKIPLVNELNETALLKLFKNICSQKAINKESTNFIIKIAAHYLTFYYLNFNEAELENTIATLPENDRFTKNLAKSLKDSFEQSNFRMLKQYKNSLPQESIKYDDQQTELQKLLDEIKIIQSKTSMSLAEKVYEQGIIIDKTLAWYVEKNLHVVKVNYLNGFFSGHTENPIMKILKNLKKNLNPYRSVLATSYQYKCNLKKNNEDEPKKDDEDKNDNSSPKQLPAYQMQLILQFPNIKTETQVSSEETLANIMQILNKPQIFVAMHSAEEQAKEFSISIAILGNLEFSTWEAILSKLQAFGFLSAKHSKDIYDNIQKQTTYTSLDVEVSTAVANKDWKEVLSLLKRNETIKISNILVGQRNTTLFLAAVAADRDDLMSHLIQNGADLNKTDATGNKCLHIAIRNNSHKSLKKLLQLRHFRDIDQWTDESTETNSSGDTPLKLAIRAYMQGKPVFLEFYFQYTGNLPESFLDDSYKLFATYVRYSSKNLTAKNILDILNIFKHKIPYDIQVAVCKFAENLSKKSILNETRVKFLREHNIQADHPFRFSEALKFLDLINAFEFPNEIRDALYKTETDEIKAIALGIKDYATYPKRALELIKNTLTDNAVLCANNPYAHKSKILKTILSLKCTSEVAEKAQNELIHLFINSGAFVSSEEIEDSPFSLLMEDPYYKLSHYYNSLLSKTGGKHASDAKVLENLFNMIREFNLTAVNAYSINNQVLQTVNAILDSSTQKLGKDTFNNLFEFFDSLQMKGHFDRISQFWWSQDGNLHFQIVLPPRPKLELADILSFAINRSITFHFEPVEGIVLLANSYEITILPKDPHRETWDEILHDLLLNGLIKKEDFQKVLNGCPIPYTSDNNLPSAEV